MELTRGLPLIGPGFRAFDLGAGGAPVPDLAAEPGGFMVAMDGAVRIHFLDWGGPADTTDIAVGGDGAASGVGAAPGVLLIHGLSQTAWSWASIAHRLRAVAHVATMDLRGHGLSDAPTTGYDPDQLAEDAIAVAEGAGLLAFADEARLPGGPGGRPFVVAGHGYGAVVAAWAANALCERCAGLVLVDGGWTDLPAETGMTPDEWLAAIAEPPEVLRSMATWLADREAFDPATWGPGEERAARTEVVETAAGSVKLAIHRHALAASVGALWTYEPASVLPAVEAEIVALAARDDDAGRHLEALREMAAARAAVGRSPIRAVSFPGLGHNLMRYVPDAVAAAIRAAVGPRSDAAADASG
jgi:pimeloyl-ACP methyl ester carboxylesterase